MAEPEEDPRIEALKQNLLRQISEKHGEMEREIGDLKSSVKAIKWFVGGLIAVFGVIAAILASAANII